MKDIAFFLCNIILSMCYTNALLKEDNKEYIWSYTTHAQYAAVIDKKKPDNCIIMNTVICTMCQTCWGEIADNTENTK
jgi:hypothetical protein